MPKRISSCSILPLITTNIVVYGIALFMAVSVIADDSWSRFRGPNGSGINTSSKLPLEFGPKKNLIWKKEIPAGHSSPVIIDDKVFLTAADDKDLLTICLNRKTGVELWRRKAPRDRTEKLDPRNHPAAPSPVVDEKNVYVFFADYGLVAYSHAGEPQWRRPLGPFTNLYGMGASPILVDDLIVLVCDQNINSFIIALNKNSGELAWKTARDEATSGHCSPIIFQPDGESVQIVVAGSFYLTSYDAQSGKKLWWVGGLCFEMKSTPVIHNGVAYINGFGSPQNQIDQKFEVKRFADVIQSKDVNKDSELTLEEMPDDLARNFFAAVDLDGSQSLNEKEWQYFRDSIASKNSIMAIRLGGSGDMTSTNLLWKYHQNIPQLPSPIVYNEQLLMISDRGIATSLNLVDGKLRFRGRLKGATGNVYASPVAADGKILLTTLSGKIAVVDAIRDLDVLAVNDMNEKCYATPAVFDNNVFVRTEKAIYCFGE